MTAGSSPAWARAAARDLIDRGLVPDESSLADRRIHQLVPTESSLAYKNSIEAV